ncbi:MAG: PAS domain S-box protein [Limisphaerales bacterium]
MRLNILPLVLRWSVWTGIGLKVNRALCEIVGYTEAELLKLTFQEITHPEDLEGGFDQGARSRGRAHHELSDGKALLSQVRRDSLVLLNVSVVHSANNRPLYFVSQIQDIGQRKETEKRLHEQAELLNRTSDAIIVRDLNNIVRFWSKGAERIYGWTAAEAIGRDMTEAMIKNSARYREASEKLEANSEWTGEIIQTRKDGGEIVVQCRWTLLRDEAGQPQAVLSINSDITEQKKMEAQFLRAQRMESVGTLASGIAHDLNNILGPILLSMPFLRAAVTAPATSKSLIAWKPPPSAARILSVRCLPLPVAPKATVSRFNFATSFPKSKKLSAKFSPKPSPFRLLEHLIFGGSQATPRKSSKSCSICASTPETRCRAADS